MQLTGIHHLTAVSASIRENFRFYTDVMGMRLVKRSVNQDDVTAYHLFYADAVGSPGTDLTFFDWSVPRERRGSRTITRTHLRVQGGDSLEYWARRLTEHGIAHGGIVQRDGRATLDFDDREGQRLALVDDGGAGDPPTPWTRSPVPPEHQIRGLGPIVMSVPSLQPTDVVVEQVLNMRRVRDYPHPDNARHTVHVYEMGAGGPHAELHVAVQPNLPAASPGAGGVHHVAFRSPDADYEAWAERLNTMGVPNSGEVDRYWFRSLYLREPNGVLFEIATDGPGFAVDEDPATLGEKVVLAPFLEPRREAILANLKPID
ncbi:ring-cleaving dioxygenase [Roseisolibacter agri]|uniref:Glyoxalase n=1 Tax=Roseisolibacter agri TaxID=2014610 RepID=A0AA37Q8H1_9BACT|nr:ring-cleaving dioxygenase [Roseisolibacter agri]GLC24261.1 glyoxalase [Roseisolibacter agri]